MILGGDIGGTKTLLSLAKFVDNRLQVVREQRFVSRNYPSFDVLLGEFLADAPAITAAAFGVAGPTDGREAQLTYLPWRLAADALRARFRLGHVTLINDFAAAANGLPLVDAERFVLLQAGQPVKGGPRLILGAGTGLGVAGLVWEDGAYRVLPGEGGHMGFSPQTPEQGRLWQKLLAAHGRVTSEDIVSGPGLARIHAFLGGPPQPAEAIGQAALLGGDSLAKRALELWLAAFGGFAGDLALHWLARGGVYLTGGIAIKLMPKTDISPFLFAFNAKREHRPLAEAMPIHLVCDERLGLLGALALARQHQAG